MKAFFLLLPAFFSITTYAQDTSSQVSKVTVYKDNRLDDLIKKETEINEAYARLLGRSAKGYRLMILSTNDRALAMNVRSELLRNFPDQKVYMIFQQPYIKLKFGDFLERDEAVKYKAEIIKSKLITNNIYLVSEKIELKTDKNKDKDPTSN